MTPNNLNTSPSNLPRPVAVKRTLEIFSDPWSFAVLQELFFRVRRFDDFQQNLNISRSVLTRRLRHLEEQQIITRKLYSNHAQRFEYVLTERGRDMYTIFVALRQWGERWLDDAQTEDLHLIHASCGQELDLQLVCGNCQHEVHASDIKLPAK
ncbi:helix-turn-helix domain-containing protein [Paraglaciecola agarilytica]|uniref:winged helix-turn-helix transcriptional regulator n=1 Tax=Paraglaciecola chathamensis TaxID=368405 RepID=UPI002356D820|nr:helix-turn-helix domain-containing protein [Paraglaciecola agarilytica]|tara:strand:- start:5788 stop:6246 length:459 start_codon:yes stop_codon:yes gene_type:complete